MFYSTTVEGPSKGPSYILLTPLEFFYIKTFKWYYFGYYTDGRNFPVESYLLKIPY